MTTNWCLGGFRSAPSTFGDTYEPDEARRAGSMEKMEKKQGASLRVLRISRQPSVPADYSCLEPARRARGRALCEALLICCCDINQAVGSVCCQKGIGGQPARAIDRCWAPRRRAAGRAAAPPRQIHHDAAAAPGRPPTELWLPSRGRAQASRHSCGRRRPK